MVPLGSYQLYNTMHNSWPKQLLFGILLVALSLPALQGWLDWLPEQPLNGAYYRHPEPTWTAENWFKAEAQRQTEAYAKQQFGGQASLVRWHNQYLYQWFRQSPNAYFFLGKEGYWYEKTYTDAYEGVDYEGRQGVREKVEHLEVIQQELAKRGKTFVLLLAPSKARYVPEFLPDWCHPGDSTNYATFLEEIQGKNLNIIDVNAWFQAEKATTPYPLFPKNGTHWSVYGMYKVVDSLLHYLDGVTGQDLPEVVLDSIWTTTWHQDPDNDIEWLLNLHYPLPRDYLAYYKAHYTTEGKWRPKLLTIGDSFWGTFHYKNYLTQDCFASSIYWYYNNTVYPEKRPRTPEDIRQVFQADVILLEVTSAHLEGMGWGALSEFKRVLTTDSPDFIRQEINAIIEQINANPEWYNSLVPKAEDRGISMDSMLYLDAVWTYQQRLLNN